MNRAVLKAALNGDIANAVTAATPGGIEQQETKGQRALVESTMLPKEIREATREQLAGIGFQFGEDVDELFVRCKLPSGWTKRATEHPMNSELLDDKGRRRAGVFYKAAFYDRRANMTMEPRFSVQVFGDGKDEKHRHASVMDGDAIVYDLGEWRKDDYALYNKLRLSGEAWLAAHYPQWKDPLAYWDLQCSGEN
ncbi:hypothetical protein [Pollutimonas bauzanensis]|uniref:Uncharacterized protein n=1 Tax=Pollutimonas bauzanensis TaxID=658167 RepID=A0A1M5YJ62_9BURK|nr:hypothetical protein [Pollutimonas bauzanensis]SHI12055.1 hypothetical protein SAMN04488135_109145 [Pollutimonas bauzanensis]